MAFAGSEPEAKNSEMGVLSMDGLLEDGKNAKYLKCERCRSTILRPGDATHTKKEQIFLPHMKKKSENQAAGEGETLSDFWLVKDMFTFENVGFTNTVDNKKFLICADCEVGPIGWQDLADSVNLYVALARVVYES
ncbi:Guanine nucleotide exchange factor MSS4 [Holothuria leucospilota]|uniref:Guanine nucleotide exchange factor MSS4 n=1 Tax=Holothuria leucospilota TaxID=206669 RepID=A0A9Q1C8M4_HOLLE|nr:Guanine nucleotide exchange factor MSS4 [Holothuria leucospilota]